MIPIAISRFPHHLMESGTIFLYYLPFISCFEFLIYNFSSESISMILFSDFPGFYMFMSFPFFN